MTAAVSFACKQCARRIASASAVGSTGGRVVFRRQQHRFKVFFDVEVADARSNPVATLTLTLIEPLRISTTVVTITCGCDVCRSICIEDGNDDDRELHAVLDL